jgi:SAM-dependent methyltransferase
VGVAGHLGIDLAEYDARIRSFIPGYEAMLEAAAVALCASLRRRSPAVVDLGIGTGALAAACLAAIPGARFVGIDEDDGMLTGARARLGSRVRVIHDSFERAPLPPCDAVVASLALHHIPTRARRLRLFRRIRKALRPGGVLLSADCHPSRHPRLSALDFDGWVAHLEQAYTPPAARRYLRTWAREDHYVPLAEELDLLRRAGFQTDVSYRTGAFAVIAAHV